MAVVYHWSPNEVSSELGSALKTLAEEYPLAEGEAAPRLRFTQDAPAGACRVGRTAEEVRISYGAVADALRALGGVLAGGPGEGSTISEERPFTTLGIMPDCSRNAVMKVEHFKRWLRRLALLGYNMAMLYTEDTYTLPEEPFFGLFRGGYTAEELQEIDAYAAGLGIEMIGCLQTLGHLAEVLKWDAYGKVKDTDWELLAGEPATYGLIGKMVTRFAECFRSRRLHVGMDETWTLGRGRFLDINGHKPGREILIQHLAEVTRICEAQGLRPMIWSDMLFRFGGDMHVDYDVESTIPDEVRRAIPENLDLVYWEYSRDKEEDYLRLIDRHRQLGREPLMASGVWTWLRLWYGREETESCAAACLRACRRAGLKEVFFTLWGDDGAYCEYDSALAGLAFASAECYGEDEEAMKRRYQAVCGIAYDDTLLGSQLEFPPSGARNLWSGDRTGAAILWDDPLLGMHSLSVGARHPGHWEEALAHYRTLGAALARHRDTTEPLDLGHAAALADLLAAKIEFRRGLEEAYAAGDREQMRSLLDTVPQLVELTDRLAQTFRRQWLRRNRPFGFETLQVRLGGLRQRFIEAGAALRELLEGERAGIPELDQGLALSADTRRSLHAGNRYRRLAAPGIL